LVPTSITYSLIFLLEIHTIMKKSSPSLTFSTLVGLLLTSSYVSAQPVVSRLTPPSELFSSGQPAPIIARFLPEQRFDLQATIKPDDANKSITKAEFAINNQVVKVSTALRDCSTGCLPNVPKNSAVATVRAITIKTPGTHTFTITATQSDGQKVVASGNFEIVPFENGGQKVKNIIIFLGDGMGVAHRSAARIVAGGFAQGKSIKPLAMDTFPVTGLVKTASLNSIVTDSAPGMAAYVSGNKSNNNEEGVFPDDTVDPFDNPRVEYLSEYLKRTQGKALGIVTTADVFDATPAANAVHTSNRGAGTGIVDQFFDDRNLTGLSVLMGGGRKWFLPSTVPGSQRSDRRWGASAGKLDKDRDLIADFKSAGFAYASDKSSLDAVNPAQTNKLLGLFAYSNMNVALDKIDGRRGKKNGVKGSVVDDFGFPDQPMLEEMTVKALDVLSKDKNGFVLMVEAASIDKQAHNMDTERWILDTIEFDNAIRVGQSFAQKRGDTLVIITADHEVSGVSLIGGSIVSDSKLAELAKDGGVANLRDKVVGAYEKAGFPKYRLANDGYPETTNVDNRLLVGYGANSDRHEDWRTNDRPIQDSQQPFSKAEPLSVYPADPTARDAEGKFMVTGQVPGNSGVHTASDIPLSAFGPGAWSFTGVMDNTDVFFILGQAAVKGVVKPKGFPSK
jgi:alkaline phosphatase